MSSVVNIVRQSMNAQSSNMSAIAGDIANMRTVGYKQSRAQFSEVINGTTHAANAAGHNAAASPVNGDTSNGFSGLTTHFTRNLLDDGTIENTGRELDMAISGPAQFVVRQYSGEALEEPGDAYLTAAGNFELRTFYPSGMMGIEDEGLYLSDKNGYNVMGALYNESTQTFTTATDLDSLEPIRFTKWADTSASPPITSTEIVLEGNLNSNDVIDTRINRTLSIYNGQGIINEDGTADSGLVRSEIPLQISLVKRTTNVWSLIYVNAQLVEGKDVSELTEEEIPDPLTTPLALVESESEQLANGWKIQFSPDGFPVRMWKGANNFPVPSDPVLDISAGGIGQITIDVTEPSPEALLPSPENPEQLTGENADPYYVVSPLELRLDMTELTSISVETNLDVTQDGSAIELRNFKDITIGDDAILYRNFTDGSSVPLAKIAGASVQSINNLNLVNGNLYAFTAESGDLTVYDLSDTTQNRFIVGALENSDVDLSEAFAKMIMGQRSYSVSAQALSTAIEMEKRALELK